MAEGICKEILDELGLPYRFHHFEVEEAVAPPFSVWMITITAWWILPPVGAVFTAVAVAVCAVRVVGGVHDEWDVVVGAMVGIVAAVIGYWIL